MTMAEIIPPRREPNGRLKRVKTTMEKLNEISRAQADAETALVRSQPHRRGEASPMAESAIGRFVLAYGLARELYDAGLQFAHVRALWLATIGAPRDERHPGSGADLEKSVADEWRDSVAVWRREMMLAGGKEGQLAVEKMACDGFDLSPADDRLKAISALMALGKAMGRV